MTDNPNVNKSLRRLIEAGYEHIIGSCCVTHQFDLLAEDIGKLSWTKGTLARGGGGGGGLTQKCRTCMGVGGCFRDPKHKSNMYTFVQQRGGVHILSRITKV